MSNWPRRPCTDPCLDIIEHLFRAPDHVESAPAPAGTLPRRVSNWWEARRRTQQARRQQAPLDKLLGVFVALAPPPLVSEIIETATGWPCMGPFRLMSESAWRRLGQDAPRRPDVVFVSSDAVFILEMKARGAKAGQEQVARDALLVQQICAALSPRRCAVVHLGRAGPGDVASLDQAVDIRRAAIRRLPHMRLAGIEGLDANGRVILSDTISAFELAAMSFTELDHVLGGYASAAAPAATEGRLIDGLRRELRFRGLADAPYLAADMMRLAG
jgi:hypothetical protein